MGFGRNETGVSLVRVTRKQASRYSLSPDLNGVLLVSRSKFQAYQVQMRERCARSRPNFFLTCQESKGGFCSFRLLGLGVVFGDRATAAILDLS